MSLDTSMWVAVVLVAAAAFVIGRMMLSDLRSRRTSRAALAGMGFRPCPQDLAMLKEVVQRLRGWPEVSLRSALRLGTDGEAVYWYEMAVPDSDAQTVAEELLLPLQRVSAQPLVLFLRPAALGEGAGGKVLEKILSLTAAAMPPGLEPVEIPRQHRSALFGAFGPPARALYDLIDDRQLTALRRGAQLGFFAVRAAERHCALEFLSAYGLRALPSFDLRYALRFAQDLAARRY